MNTKGKGTRNEHRAIHPIAAAGFSCTRAAASLGMFDVIAIGRQGWNGSLNALFAPGKALARAGSSPGMPFFSLRPVSAAS